MPDEEECEDGEVEAEDEAECHLKADSLEDKGKQAKIENCEKKKMIGVKRAA